MDVATASIDGAYRRHRRSAYAGIFVGYAAYYLCRNSLALAIPDILKEFPQYSKADLGWALTGLSISYGISKFLMGSVSDRSNPKYFLPLGLLISSGIMFAMGTVKTMYASLASVAVIAFVLMRDTPEAYGLPPVEDYKRERETSLAAERSRSFSYREIFFEHVLTNRNLWLIAVANAFIYFVRYGVVNWIPTYLQTAKGFSFNESSTGWALYEFAAIPGTVACGWVSDKVFKGRRAPATILFMALTLLAVIAYWLNAHGPLWIDYAALFAIGFLIYGPIMIVGLHALDLVPKKAAGTAAGFTGFFGYVFGSAIAGSGVGWIADHWGWPGVFMTMVVCCVLAIAFSAMTLGHTATSASRTAASR